MQNQIDPDQFEFMGMGEANTNPILLPPQQPMAPQSQQDLGHLVFPQDPSNMARGSLLPYIGQVGPDGKIIKGTEQWALPSMVRDTINDLALTAMAPGYAAQGRLVSSDLPAVANRMGMTLAAGGIGASTLVEPELDANVLGSFRGFHGTPHTFEPVDHNPFGEFSDQKIGSGEGAQIYGHGHYVAGNPKTGRLYSNQMPYSQGEPGSLYHVEIQPDEHELLDWDQPLSQQSPQVQSKLQAMGIPLDKTKGGQLYGWLQGVTGQGDAESVSNYLHENGIPGLKHVDQWSHSKAPEDQTHNYTIFHPSNLKIVGRNGEELAAQPIEHDPFTHSAESVEHDPFGAQP